MRSPLRKSIHRTIVCVLAFSVVGVSDAAAQSAGSQFQTSTLGSGARAMGMGGAFVAVADDATAASWNPAGLSLLVRPEVSFVHDFTRIENSVPVSTSTTMNGSITVQRVTNPSYSFAMNSRDPEFFSVTYPISTGRLKVVPQFSFRRVIKRSFDYYYTRAPILIENPAIGTRSESTQALTFESHGGVDVFAGTVAVSFDPRWHLGVAVNAWRGDWESSSVSRSGPPGGLASTQTTISHESTSAISADVGVLFKPVRQLAVGAVVRTRFGLDRDFNGDSQFAYPVPPPPASTSRSTNEQHGEIKWPMSVSMGVSLSPIDALIVAFDYTYADWSDATITGTSTTVTTFMPGGAPPRTTTSSVSTTYPFSSATVAQQDSYQLRGGAEYVMRRSSTGSFVGIPIRAGVYRDKLMQPQLDGSSMGSIGITAGAGALWRRLSIDIGYVRESINGDLTASTRFDVVTGVTTTVGAAESSSEFDRFVLSTTVRF